MNTKFHHMVNTVIQIEGEENQVTSSTQWHFFYDVESHQGRTLWTHPCRVNPGYTTLLTRTVYRVSEFSSQWSLGSKPKAWPIELSLEGIICSMITIIICNYLADQLKNLNHSLLLLIKALALTELEGFIQHIQIKSNILVLILV